MRMKTRLLVPGPTPTPPEVKLAAMQELIDERTSEFGVIYSRVVSNLKKLMCTDNDIFMFASSITGASESIIQNLFSPGDKILVASNGFFGERWIRLCQAFGLDVIELDFKWGNKIDNEMVKSSISNDPDIKAAICVHCETSTSMVNDVKGFCEAANGVLKIVDGASSLGVCKLKTDEWGIDVLVSGGQKAMMCPPGLSFISVSNRAWKCHLDSKMSRFYFDWSLAKENIDSSPSPWTPAISLIMQLDTAILRMLEEGLDNILQRHIVLGRMVRSGVQAIGLTLFASDSDVNSAVTAVILPDFIPADSFLKSLNLKYGIQVAPGVGELKNRIIRIGHCGYFDVFDILNVLSAIELLLYQYGYHHQFGSAVVAAQKVLVEEEGAIVSDLLLS
ncbi:Soluble hydrogenase 42 kDa subunit [compost metagenome]